MTDSIDVNINYAEPETCLHCRIGRLVGDMIKRDFNNRLEVGDVAGALLALAGEMIGQAPTREMRRSLLARGIEVLRDEVKASARHPAAPAPRVH